LTFVLHPKRLVALRSKITEILYGGANRGAGQSQLAQAPLKKAEQVAEPRGASCNTVSSIRPWMLCSGGQADIHRVALAAEPVRRQKPPCRRREGPW